MKVGYLERPVDISGVSGTGSVAEFVISTDGRIVIFWPVGKSEFPTLEDAMKVHGHSGSTRFVILTDEVEDVPHCGTCHGADSSPESRAKCQDHDFGCPACLAQVG